MNLKGLENQEWPLAKEADRNKNDQVEMTKIEMKNNQWNKKSMKQRVALSEDK